MRPLLPLAVSLWAAGLAHAQTQLEDHAHFGDGAALIGDLSGSGRPWIAVGSPDHDAGAGESGAVWLHELDAAGEIVTTAKISAVDGGFGGTLPDGAGFGSDVTGLGDVDGDGTPDLAVAAEGLEALWVLLLDPDGTVHAEVRIAANQGGFTAFPEAGDDFASSIAGIGDLDGDGTPDLAVGEMGADDGVPGSGAVWILFLGSDGLVDEHAKISNLFGGLPGGAGTLGVDEGFGYGLGRIDDVDGDGTDDLVVGALGEDSNEGSVWVVMLETDGSVQAAQRIAEDEGGFVGPVGLWFAEDVAGISDLDGDSVPELAVGTPQANRVWVLFLDSDGTVASQVQLDTTGGGVTGLVGTEFFGSSCVDVGDVDGDGTNDLVVGGILDAQFGPGRGAAWTLFLNASGTVDGQAKLFPLADEVPGTVIDHLRITEGSAGFLGDLASGDGFGSGVAGVGDLDGDGNLDVAVGAPGSDVFAVDDGAVWILLLNGDGTVKDERRIAALENGFLALPGLEAGFGTSIDTLGDFDGNGTVDLVVGAPGDGSAAPLAGAVWLVMMNSDGTVASQSRITSGRNGFVDPLDAGDGFGTGVAVLGDVDGNGVVDLAVGAPGDDGSGSASGIDRGAFWVVFLNGDGTVSSAVHHVPFSLGFTSFSQDDRLGAGIGAAGDADGNGVGDLLIGAPGYVSGSFSSDNGRGFLVLLGDSGEIVGSERLDTGESSGEMGSGLTAVGDLNGDGNVDVAAGAPGRLGGAVSVAFLDAGGALDGTQLIEEGSPGFTATLELDDRFGQDVAGLGDFDGDGIFDLAVGASGDASSGAAVGAVYVLRMNGVATGDASPYGCASPVESLVLVDGVPAPGALLTLGLTNPVGTQSAGAASIFVVATQALPGCGVPIAGAGMTPGVPGELLVDLASTVLFTAGPVWAGPGTYAEITLPIPAGASVAGLSFFAQGALVDAPPRSGVGLSTGLEIRIAP